jgi:hypothetical protein
MQTMITFVSFYINSLSFALISVGYEMRKKLVYSMGIKNNTKMVKRTIMQLKNILRKDRMYRNQLRLSMYII